MGLYNVTGAAKPKATVYSRVKVPNESGTYNDFCFKVVDETTVLMIPWSMCGEHGEGYFETAVSRS
jgi:aspartate/methionine/tyrosine aminotransferase